MATEKKTHNTALADALKTLLEQGNIRTQADMRMALDKQGIIVSQPKLSRLLNKLGAIKMRGHHGATIYSLAPEPPLPPKQSQLGQLVLDIAANETMLVIRTNPGSASLIARLLDYHRQELRILGTLAGDDTLFVVPRSTQQLETLILGIKELL